MHAEDTENLGEQSAGENRPDSSIVIGVTHLYV